jgi:hypothetical protein
MVSARMLALAVGLMVFVATGDVSAQGAANVAPRGAAVRAPAAAPLIAELRPNAIDDANATHGAFSATDGKGCRPVVSVC